MITVIQKLDKLENTSSTNAKVELLKDYLQDELFRKVVVYAMDSRKTFKVKKFPAHLSAPYPGSNASMIFDHLDFLNNKEGATDSNKKRLFALASKDAETYEVVKRICNQDLKCGVGVSLVNSARPNTVFDIPYCRCSTDKKIDRISYPCYVQEKADGMFSNNMISDDVQFLSREGKPIQQLHRLTDIVGLHKHEYPEHNIQGELRIRDPKTGLLLPRQVGNGILNSCLYGSADQNLADNAVFCIWNMVTLDDFWNHESTTPYRDVLHNMEYIVRNIDSPYLMMIPGEIAKSYEDAEAFYRKIRKQGGEGAIIKDFRFKWKYHTSTLQIKMKNVSDADLVLVGWNYADEDSKYAGKMGALIFESRCGKLSVKVGTGFSDKQRAHNWDDEIGNVGALEYESVSKSKTNKIHSLYLPRFIEMRSDRNKRNADTLYDLMNR